MVQLRAVYNRALQTIADAGGIEGDVLKPIAYDADPAQPERCVGSAIIAAALYERARRGYATALPPSDGPSVERSSCAFLVIERGHARREQHLSSFVDTCAQRIGQRESLQPLQYLFAELTANIWDHAETSVGFLAFGTGSQTCALAVVDTGISIPFSYARRDIVLDGDRDALRAALSGRSARPQGGRGYGLRTSAALIIEGWDGTLLLASRHATVLRTEAGDDAQETSPLHWNGTVVAAALPLPLRSVDLYAYVER